MMNGNDAILLWNDEPIACLTSNSLSEVLTFLATSKKTINGAQTFKPVANSYQINFEAVMAVGVGMSWEELAQLFREMRAGTWEVDLGVLGGDTGYGYLANLELTANSGENIIFTGTILGQGAIASTPVIWNVWAQSPSFNVDEGGRYVLVSP